MLTLTNTTVLVLDCLACLLVYPLYYKLELMPLSYLVVVMFERLSSWQDRMIILVRGTALSKAETIVGIGHLTWRGHCQSQVIRSSY